MFAIHYYHGSMPQAGAYARLRWARRRTVAPTATLSSSPLAGAGYINGGCEVLWPFEQYRSNAQHVLFSSRSVTVYYTYFFGHLKLAGKFISDSNKFHRSIEDHKSVKKSRKFYKTASFNCNFILINVFFLNLNIFVFTSILILY